MLASYDRLDVLVNNAGLATRRREVTEDGIERTFAVNHLGPFLLTNLLLDLLVKSAPARIVNVASSEHYDATMDLADLGFERGGWGTVKAYRRSKLGNVLFTRALANRLEGKGVTVNAVHPGAVATGRRGERSRRTSPLMMRHLSGLCGRRPPPQRSAGRLLLVSPPCLIALNTIPKKGWQANNPQVDPQTTKFQPTPASVKLTPASRGATKKSAHRMFAFNPGFSSGRTKLSANPEPCRAMIGKPAALSANPGCTPDDLRSSQSGAMRTARNTMSA